MITLAESVFEIGLHPPTQVALRLRFQLPLTGGQPCKVSVPLARRIRQHSVAIQSASLPREVRTAPFVETDEHGFEKGVVQIGRSTVAQRGRQSRLDLSRFPVFGKHAQLSHGKIVSRAVQKPTQQEVMDPAPKADHAVDRHDRYTFPVLLD